jgi:hypothetical protein
MCARAQHGNSTKGICGEEKNKESKIPRGITAVCKKVGTITCM